MNQELSLSILAGFILVGGGVSMGIEAARAITPSAAAPRAAHSLVMTEAEKNGLAVVGAESQSGIEGAPDLGEEAASPPFLFINIMPSPPISFVVQSREEFRRFSGRVTHSSRHATFSLSRGKPIDREWGVELLRVEADGTTHIRRLEDGEELSARPGEEFSAGAYVVKALQLAKSFPNTQEANIRAIWCESRYEEGKR